MFWKTLQKHHRHQRQLPSQTCTLHGNTLILHLCCLATTSTVTILDGGGLGQVDTTPIQFMVEAAGDEVTAVMAVMAVMVVTAVIINNETGPRPDRDRSETDQKPVRVPHRDLTSDIVD